MKGIVNKIMLAVAAVLAFASCVKSEDAVVKELAGDWYYETVEADTPVQVYVSFAKDMTFELYQKVGEGAFRKYSGTYTFDGTLLDGVYSDKAPWKEAKTVTIDGDSLTAVGVKTGETITYVRKLVPATVRYHYSDALKSMPVSAEPWL
ncbi:MAG: lipocalin family protein [Bacteroidales bacterium]|jgi:hypothetical protein|nr:lipocalin family protein [Bacteroidales bacterium]MBQ5602821.1 lipocalin family protein [Bacteroidales bacterium]